MYRRVVVVAGRRASVAVVLLAALRFWRGRERYTQEAGEEVRLNRRGG